MKNRIAYLIIPVVLGLVIFACKRNFKEDYAGPLLCPTDAFVDVSLLVVKDATTNSTSTVDLSTHKLAITASFNELIPWTVKITGMTSGASKTITGSSTQVNIQWIGDSDAAPFFRAEQLKVSLFIACKQEVHNSALINNTAAPSFIQLPGFVGNFNQSILTPPAPTQPLPQGQYTDNSIGVVDPSNPAYDPSPQGGNYMNIIGDVNYSDPTAGPQWYYGAFEFDGLANKLNGLNADPSKVWINFYANNGGAPNSQISLALYERFNGIAKKRSKSINLTWTGWKMVSIRLSDIGMIDARKIYNINFGLGPYLNKDVYGVMNVDFVVLTNDKPFFPQE